MHRFLFSLVVLPTLLLAARDDRYEVWAIDQSNSPGKVFGGTIYIWDGKAVERNPRSAQPEKIDLSGAATALCQSRTGADPVRPHMIAMNPSQTHAIVSFVASGHVLFIDAARREPVECVRMSVGADGARQVHMATPAADETYVAAANQNGKLLERINTDYANNRFTLDTVAGINLATCRTPSNAPCQDPVLRPDNAPICPIIDSSSRLTFVTMRGGGLFVVDSKSTPMRIIAEYDKETVHPNGCLGAETKGKMYINSGGGTAANLYESDLYVFRLNFFAPSNPPNTPAPQIVISDDVDGADSHGHVLTHNERFLWMADRGRNFIYVVNTRRDTIVNRISLESSLSADPTPDLMALSPNGNYVYMSLRGPNPLTADPHVSTGTTPGVGVVLVKNNGRDGQMESLLPVTNIDGGGVERADVHAMTIRVIREK
jgi:DNA-binding beta-propeller fold protein YncE